VAGAELQQVNTDIWLNVQELQALLAAAPQLQVLNTGVIGKCRALLPVLRSDPPYGPLRVNQLVVGFAQLEPEDAEDDVLAVAAALVAARQIPQCLFLNQVAFARGLNALVDAAAERRVSSLKVLGCVTDAQTVPALARLLQRGSLTMLVVNCEGFTHASEASVLELCAALRTCRTLTHLELRFKPANEVTRLAFTELLDAAAALPALSVLSLLGSRVAVQDKAAAGQALGALLRANLPSLHTLIANSYLLGDEGAALVLDGLAANTHLRKLYCQYFNDLSEVFKRDQLEPALMVLAARAELDE
jgi:hypothetical protein